MSLLLVRFSKHFHILNRCTLFQGVKIADSVSLDISHAYVYLSFYALVASKTNPYKALDVIYHPAYLVFNFAGKSEKRKFNL